MKKKIVIGSLLGIIIVTGLILLIGFNAPIFYNTEYSVYEDGKYVGYFKITTESSVTYKSVTEKESNIYYKIKNNVLTFNHNEFTIKSKFRLVNENYQDVYASPSGGGYSIFCVTLIINIISLTTLISMLGIAIYERQKYINAQLKKIEQLELVNEKDS